MADQQQQQQQQPMQAPFPAPPPFYQHFTKQNLSELRRLRKEAGVPTDRKDNEGSNGEQKRDIDILSLPTELRYLIPPPSPADGTFKSFGFSRSLTAPSPSLAELGIEQLYPDHPSVRLNPQSHLISLARSQLTTFLTLVGNLSVNPDEGWKEPTKDLEVLNYNMQDLINQYRPHQARETLIMMMEERVERMKAEVKAIHDGREKVREVMRGLQDAVGSGGGGAEGMDLDKETKDKVEVEDAKRKARQRAAWAAIEAGTEI